MEEEDNHIKLQNINYLKYLKRVGENLLDSTGPVFVAISVFKFLIIYYELVA